MSGPSDSGCTGRDASRSAGGELDVTACAGDGAAVRVAGDAGDGSEVRASSGSGGRRLGDDTGTATPGDAEDFGEKVAITTATNINKPSRETEEIN